MMAHLMETARLRLLYLSSVPHLSMYISAFEQYVRGAPGKEVAHSSPSSPLPPPPPPHPPPPPPATTSCAGTTACMFREYEFIWRVSISWVPCLLWCVASLSCAATPAEL